MNNRTTEKLEILAGERGERQKMAVRIEDLIPLVRRDNALKVQKVTSAPTAAQYNALVDQLQSLNEVLNQIAKSLQAKIIR